ncbi:TetR/AcrR family transcriptional regulator [Streptomyces sp. NPDC046805]|uniref:TetR/AcrR family transcriptional regulator n=1 Tax=Streptomyces sp. NPDC046805 TaxID=3155134 RepID=UPI0033FBE00E
MTSGSQRATRRTPRQDRSRAMVERILAAGREVLLERGYERTSTSRIAARAGISPGSLYQYFPNKEAILGRVLARYVEQLQHRITDAFVSHLDATDSVRRTIEALLDALETDATLLRVVYEQPSRSADPQRADFVRRIDDLVTTALLFQRRPAGRPVDSIAWVLVRTIESVTVNFVLDPPRIDRESIVDELTRLIEGYLAVSSAQAQAVSGAQSSTAVDTVPAMRSSMMSRTVGHSSSRIE